MSIERTPLAQQHYDSVAKDALDKYARNVLAEFARKIELAAKPLAEKEDSDDD